MSAGGPGQREVAHRLFAAEFDDATYTYTESDEDRAPNYVVTPTGARVNRLFLVGVLTETEWVNEETIRARVVDPTGPFVLYASQYQPDARGALDGADPPTFIAVTGKANTFRPDGSDRIYSSVRPEAVATVDADTRDRWAVAAAERTIGRLGRLATAISSGDDTDRGVEIARREYEPTAAYVSALYEVCLDVLRLVADEIETLPDRSLDPHMAGDPSTPLEDIVDVAGRVVTTDATPHGRPPEDESPSPEQVDESEEVVAGEADEAGDEPQEDDAREADEAGDEPEEDDAREADEADDELAAETEEEVLSTDEREEIEASFGTDFTTGDEIESPSGEADADAEGDSPDPAPPSEQAESMPEESEPPDDEDATPSDPQEGTDPADESATQELTVDALIELMRDLAGDDGIARDELIEAGGEAFDADEEAIAETLQNALLAGRCYESGDDVIRPI